MSGHTPWEEVKRNRLKPVKVGWCQCWCGCGLDTEGLICTECREGSHQEDIENDTFDDGIDNEFDV